MCRLRFDDTNPVTEETEYVDAIVDDIRWLGFDPGEPLYASDYFETAVPVGRAPHHRRASPTSTTRTPRPSPRSAADTASPASRARSATAASTRTSTLFRAMRAASCPTARTCCAPRATCSTRTCSCAIPVMYRIRHEPTTAPATSGASTPPTTGPTARATPSRASRTRLCSLEFDSHRPLYDWYLEHLPLPGDQPRQIEFARLELTHTVTSKRKLRQLDQRRHRRGLGRPAPAHAACPAPPRLSRRARSATSATFIGVAKTNSRHQIELLEWFIRNELNRTALRRMAVLRPMKLVVTNWPAGHVERRAGQQPGEPRRRCRARWTFTGELWIEADDFNADPPPKYFRLTPGSEVRLRGAYFVKCTGFTTDDDGNVTEVQCTYDPDTRGGRRPTAAR